MTRTVLSQPRRASCRDARLEQIRAVSGPMHYLGSYIWRLAAGTRVDLLLMPTEVLGFDGDCAVPATARPRLSRRLRELVRADTARVGYVGSYIWRLRQVVGSDLLLMPGAQILVVDDDDRVLFQRRRDSGLWEFPAGAAEPGSTFRGTAASELLEESGLEVAESDLIPFASLSDPAVHLITYPNGDRLHCFALCFVTHRWTGRLKPDPAEVQDLAFRPLTDPPDPLQPQTRAVLDLYLTYRTTGVFQAH